MSLDLLPPKKKRLRTATGTFQANDIVAWIDRTITVNELGHPFRLADYQREVFRTAFVFDAQGRLPWDTFLYSTLKKSGKTTLNALVTLWWAETQEAPNEILMAANDLEQVQARTFT